MYVGHLTPRTSINDSNSYDGKTCALFCLSGCLYSENERPVCVACGQFVEQEFLIEYHQKALSFHVGS